MRNQYSKIENLFNRGILSPADIRNTRLIKFLTHILLNKIEQVRFFNDSQALIEDLFIKGEYDKVYQVLDELNEKCGISIWEIKLRLAIYTAKKEYSKIDEYLEGLKSKNENSFFQDIIRVTAWKSHSIDSDLIIESMVRRPNKEFIEGKALNIAAFYSLTMLHFPLYDDVNLRYAINWLQKFTIIFFVEIPV